MNTSLKEDQLLLYLRSQLCNFFPDCGSLANLNKVIPLALQKLDICFQGTKYCGNYCNGEIFFNHLNADQYLIFIYYCSNISFCVFIDVPLASKLFYLNKALHGFHCMYDTILPEVFVIVHGSGIVLGKAVYSNYLVICHGCTVGSNSKFESPNLGQFLMMYPNSSIIGNSVISNNCCISNGSFVNDEFVSSNSLVFGSSPNLVIKKNRRDRLSYFFSV